MAIVLSADRHRATPVKNLGWILRNWKDVESFEFAEPTSGRPVTDLILVAHCRDGRVYLTHFASLAMCLNFLHRPIFYGLTVKNHLASRPGAYNLGSQFTLTRVR